MSDVPPSPIPPRQGSKSPEPDETLLQRGFYDGDSLHIRAYDSLLEAGIPSLVGDIEFYIRAAQHSGGPILDIGTGTGRVAWALADHGFQVTGMDVAPEMIRLAGMKSLNQQPTTAAASPTFIVGDMRRFEIGRQFGLIIVPFRTFHVLENPDEQLASLISMRQHLRPKGRVILHMFDPRIDDISTFRKPPEEERHARDAETGFPIIARLKDVHIDRFAQIITNTWLYSMEGRDGSVIRTESLTMTARWTYRFEMKHLLARAGLVVVEEYGDFLGGPPDHGTEQILICETRSETDDIPRP